MNTRTKEVRLLTHQYEVLADTTTRTIGMISGYGGGKTYTACRKAIQLAHLNIGFTGIVTEPTHDMIRNIFIPEMKQALEEWGIKYNLNKSTSTFYLNIAGVETSVLCLSAENYERLVGINAAWAIMDEADTSKQEIATKAYQKILGRIRTGNVRQICIFSTPEGYKFCYNLFVEDKTPNKRMIQAKTSDNKYLPPDFIKTLEQQYPPNLLKAYLEGEFVNLTSGTIFNYFDRKRHNTDIIENDSEALYISQDFNIENCISTVYVKRLINGIVKLIQVYEIESYDTKAIITNIKHTYPNRVINMYPDASSASRKTSASETDLQMLRGAGFNVFVNGRNPSVRDRIVITNNCFDKDIVLVNVNRCPKTAKAYEQHSYDEKGQPMKFNGAGTVDDFTDAATYILAYLFPIGHKIQKIGMTGV